MELTTPVQLSGRRILITGAAGGLGPVAARLAAEGGARLILADISAGSLADLADELGDAVEVTSTADLLDPEATRGLVESAVAACGGIDATWHLVGGWKGGRPLEEQPVEDLTWLYNLSVRTTWHVAHAVTAVLLASAYGRFLTVSTPQATAPTSSNAAYAAMKAASDALVLALGDRFQGTNAAAAIVVVPAILTPTMRQRNPDRPGFVPAEQIAHELTTLTCADAGAVNGKRFPLTPGA